MSYGSSLLKTLGTALALGVGLMGAGQAVADDPIKVGFVYVGPVGDAGWSYAHDLGRKALEEALGDRVETTYIESVQEGADAERVIRRLASSGHKVIFATSFGYMNSVQRVASSFPDVYFSHATGYRTAENVGVYNSRMYEGTYLQGVLAGHMTESNRLGVVASYPIPEVIRNINAFALGARSVNPDATVRVIWVNTWYDPARERQAAEALIAQGVDVLGQNTDSPAIVQVAQQRGLYAFGWDSDMSKYGPDSQLTATMLMWGGYYIDTVKAALDGTWETHNIVWGMQEGMVEMAPLNSAVPEAAAADFHAAQAGIMDGSLNPFAGPLRDQSGTVRVAEGEDMPVDDLMTMDWYVEGVMGSIPN
ncbi:BMP family ABC transporter substrate-binding protein [Alkalilimnicola ehrlichii]|uniref:BMP family ABC transporter substrate-binding protein n=1 Tax=Alkalilimnicola ehrlichii TaxID=351052 RepID=A0A3E0WI89_9GAMM|nr:BMP family ABC transporter substrate-binding protein [Alkalilimnicola ehrlichii]RFA29416.1 BMP family ABC transporter substrate-binding protein [Alkalilimnicola ehrlichii]RFA31933.1 BMP family ABC transporter substrate-binding protein [Alkalilimnicola ehrlichii]